MRFRPAHELDAVTVTLKLALLVIVAGTQRISSRHRGPWQQTYAQEIVLLEE